MTYAKHKTTQAEFVKAWWAEKDRKAWEKLKRHYPGIETVSFYGGMEYADKLRNIPNNALRRAGLKPIRRNGRRKKERTVLSQASMRRIHRGIDRGVTQIAALEMAKATEQFADVCEMGEAFPENHYFSENHYQEDALDAMLFHFEAEKQRPYLGRVMHYKNEPFLRLE